jgi:hypothetical protein
VGVVRMQLGGAVVMALRSVVLRSVVLRSVVPD